MSNAPAGRFAPSPSGDLHVGNLRTALLAWLLARSTRRRFLIRVDDLDRVQPGSAERQLEDIAALGLDWDDRPTFQSLRSDRYASVIQHLVAEGLTYPCFCTRREILEAPSAPHAPPGMYPGTCRELSDNERRRRATERPGAIRLRADVTEFTVSDLLHGSFTGLVDDFVLMRNDGVAAYNLATVVDDADLGVDQVVRGDDLLASAPRQAYLATLLGYEPPIFAHVPLALNRAGQRLAKRDGAVTRRELEDRGIDVLALIATSLGLRGSTPAEMLESFDLGALPREPWTFLPPS
jgi:glutamyl-tRNA synthetase